MAFSGDVLLPVGQWVDIRAAAKAKGADWTIDTAIIVQNKTRTPAILISRDQMPAPGTREGGVLTFARSSPFGAGEGAFAISLNASGALFVQEDANADQ